MENKKIIYVIICMLFFYSCKNFEAEKIVINYKEGYVKILSDNYVVDSLIISNNTKKYFELSLSNKKAGSNIIFFKKQNRNYKIFVDSLGKYCAEQEEKKLPSLEIFIRKKTFTLSLEKSGDTDIEFADFNQIPCNSIVIDTIKTHNPKR